MSFEMTRGGRCVSAERALEMFEVFVPDALSTSDCEIDPDEYEYALNRFRWLAQRMEPVSPRFHKGAHGKKYDSFTCGACGNIVRVENRYCPGCGRAIDW